MEVPAEGVPRCTKTEPTSFPLEEDVDLSSITPMPKHVFLNTLPGHLAPFQTIPRSRYDTDRSQREFYGQESLLNNFITTHCRDYSSANTTLTNGTDDNQHNPNPQGLSTNSSSLKRNQCAICSRVFANPASLKQHMRLHLGEKPFKCRYCDKTSATMCNILTHERIHTHERPYKCLVCTADFSSSSNLKTHMRTHSGDRPFRCNICDRRFVTSNALTTHLRVHWGLRLHPCPLCDRQFSTSSNLRVHHRTVHLGIKQYRCSVCGKAFATSSNLNAHSRQHPESAYIVKYSPPSPSTAPPPHPQTAVSYSTTTMAATANNIVVVSSALTYQLMSSSPPIQQGVTIMAPLGAPAEVNADAVESNSVVGLLASSAPTTSYNPAPTLIPVALSPNPSVRKMAKVSVYCDVEAPTGSFSKQPVKMAPDE
ncbi:hypothetical protein Aperf_G00000112779 [Anoplocephala perfoliata]